MVMWLMEVIWQMKLIWPTLNNIISLNEKKRHLNTVAESQKNWFSQDLAAFLDHVQGRAAVVALLLVALA